MNKSNLILSLLITLLAGIILIILTTLNDNDCKKFYSVLGYRLSLLITVVIIVSLLCLPVYYKSKSTKKTIHNEKENIFLKLYNRLQYPVLIEFDNFYWYVKKINRKYKVDKIPWCLKDKIKLNHWTNQFDGLEYLCPICKNDFKNIKITFIHQSVINILKSRGIKYFNNKVIKLK